MKITALLVLKCAPETSEPVMLANASDVSHFGYFQRASVREFVVFVGRTVASRTPPSQRQSVQHEEYKVHAYNRNGLCAVGFMDDHYPVRSAFSVLNQVLDEYQMSFGEAWRSAEEDSRQTWPYLTEALNRYQDPAEADQLLEIQRELDETQIILGTVSEAPSSDTPGDVTGVSSSTDTAPQKRGPGRPPKVKSGDTPKLQKRGPGRPPKVKSGDTPKLQKRRPGRPPKVKSGDTPTLQKRGPGRPPGPKTKSMADASGSVTRTEFEEQKRQLCELKDRLAHLEHVVNGSGNLAN